MMDVTTSNEAFNNTFQTAGLGGLTAMKSIERNGSQTRMTNISELLRNSRDGGVSASREG